MPPRFRIMPCIGFLIDRILLEVRLEQQPVQGNFEIIEILRTCAGRPDRSCTDTGAVNQ